MKKENLCCTVGMVVECEIKESHLGQKEKWWECCEACADGQASADGFHRSVGIFLLVEQSKL